MSEERKPPSSGRPAETGGEWRVSSYGGRPMLDTRPTDPDHIGWGPVSPEQESLLRHICDAHNAALRAERERVERERRRADRNYDACDGFREDARAANERAEKMRPVYEAAMAFGRYYDSSNVTEGDIERTRPFWRLCAAIRADLRGEEE